MSRRHTQLGFDFFNAAPAASDVRSSDASLSDASWGALPAAPPSVPAPSLTQSVTAAVSQLFTQLFSPVLTPAFEIGRASCRERVWRYV